MRLVHTEQWDCLNIVMSTMTIMVLLILSLTSQVITRYMVLYNRMPLLVADKIPALVTHKIPLGDWKLRRRSRSDDLKKNVSSLVIKDKPSLMESIEKLRV